MVQFNMIDFQKIKQYEKVCFRSKDRGEEKRVERSDKQNQKEQELPKCDATSINGTYYNSIRDDPVLSPKVKSHKDSVFYYYYYYFSPDILHKKGVDM